jgi:YggT family protein
MNDILSYVLSTIFQVMAFFFVLRFLLQVCRVDFYNPISQGIVKATDIFLRPLRVVIPGYKNLDIAAFLAAVAVHALMLTALVVIGGQYSGGVALIIGESLLSIILLHLFIIRWSILIAIIASWIAPGNSHPALALLSQLTEPVLAPARRLLPALGGLDLSPIVIFLILGVIERLLPQIFQSVLG